MHADPHQQVNLAAERPEVAAEMLAHLAEWRQAQIQAGGAPDPLEAMVTTGPFLYYTPAQMIARMERTGRSHLVPELRARLARYGTPV